MYINTYESVSKSSRTESITKYTLITISTRWEATQRVMAANLTRLTHKISIQLHLVAESCTTCSSRCRRPVRKLFRYTVVQPYSMMENIFPLATFICCYFCFHLYDYTSGSPSLSRSSVTAWAVASEVENNFPLKFQREILTVLLISIPQLITCGLKF
jgi:hypothetical protein